MKAQLFISLLMLIFISCEDGGENSNAPQNDGEKKPEVTESLEEAFETTPTASGQVQNGLCYEDQYAPSETEISRKLDIIVVPDTSSSIIEERSDIAKGFSSLINSLPSEVDYRIGVVLGHGPQSSHSAKLYRKGSEDLVLDSQLLTKEEIIAGLDKKMKYPAGDWRTDGGEMGVLSLSNAFANNLETIRSQGLLREDAALAIVFVADEQDICANYPTGVIPVVDPQGKETSAYNKYCLDNDGFLKYGPEQFLTLLESVQGDRPLIVGGVIYNNNDTIPHGGENEIGYGYKEIIELAGGLIIDLADGSYEKNLAKYGKLAQVSIQPINEFLLKTDQVNLSSISVLVNNKPVEYSFDNELNILTLNSPREPFDVVNINYCEKVKPPKEILKLISGGSHNCAILYDGKMKCWGDNSFGQLGLGHTDNIGDNEKPSSILALQFSYEVVDAAAGLYHTCALLKNGKVKCFGDNSRGQLGQGNTDTLGDNETIDQIDFVPLPEKAIRIYAGTRYNCALLENRDIKCWGENNFGQLGYGHSDNLGDNEELSSYGNVPIGSKVSQLDISTISFHTCAVLSNTGDMKCWGLNNFGQLGYGNKENLGDNEPLSSYGVISFGKNVLQLATGFIHTCAVLDGQELKCFGSNIFGQIAYGSPIVIGDDEGGEQAPIIDLGSSGFNFVATGNNHTCALNLDGTLNCFGLNNVGQLGLGMTDSIGDNESVGSNSKVDIDLALSQVSSGLSHNCVLTKDETKVICFGDNSQGQLGLGNTNIIGDDEKPWEFSEILAPLERQEQTQIL